MLSPEQMPVMRPLPMDDPGLRKWEILEDWEVEYQGGKIFIPKRFVFDGASIPRFFRRIYSPTGYLFLAGLVHDYCYRHGYYMFNDFEYDFKTTVNQEQADALFMGLANKFYPDHQKKSWVAYKSLRLGGCIAWENNKKLREAA